MALPYRVLYPIKPVKTHVLLIGRSIENLLPPPESLEIRPLKYNDAHAHISAVITVQQLHHLKHGVKRIRLFSEPAKRPGGWRTNTDSHKDLMYATMQAVYSIITEIFPFWMIPLSRGYSG